MATGAGTGAAGCGTGGTGLATGSRGNCVKILRSRFWLEIDR